MRLTRRARLLVVAGAVGIGLLVVVLMVVAPPWTWSTGAWEAVGTWVAGFVTAGALLLTWSALRTEQEALSEEKAARARDEDEQRRTTAGAIRPILGRDALGQPQWHVANASNQQFTDVHARRLTHYLRDPRFVPGRDKVEIIEKYGEWEPLEATVGLDRVVLPDLPVDLPSGTRSVGEDHVELTYLDPWGTRWHRRWNGALAPVDTATP